MLRIIKWKNIKINQNDMLKKISEHKIIKIKQRSYIKAEHITQKCINKIEAH